MDAPRTAGLVVCFGELLLRLTAPDGEMLLQTPNLRVWAAGAEANVAVGLTSLGSRARVVSTLPDNPLGGAALAELRRWGVDAGGVTTGPGRMGLYFLEPGAGARAGEVTYDRAGSAFALAAPETVDWDSQLAGASWLHLSGVTPAIGANGAAAALRAVQSAVRLDVPVSFDGNYRARLWADWEGDGPAILREILAHATLALVNDQDIALVLGRPFGEMDPAARLRSAAAAAFDAFPRLQRIAATSRHRHDVAHQDYAGAAFGRDGTAQTSRIHSLAGIVDRIGAGDAFAAGLLHADLRGWDAQRAIDFATAAAVVKHSIRGDFNLATEAQVEAVARGVITDVRR